MRYLVINKSNELSCGMFLAEKMIDYLFDVNIQNL